MLDKVSRILDMGHHCCSKQKVKRGLWSPEEDEKLVKYITSHGHSCWSTVPKEAGLSLSRSLSLLLGSIYLKFLVGVFRVTKVWKELQAKVDQLLEA